MHEILIRISSVFKWWLLARGNSIIKVILGSIFDYNSITVLLMSAMNFVKIVGNDRRVKILAERCTTGLNHIMNEENGKT